MTLVPMTEPEFQQFVEASCEEYARSKVRAGVASAERAREVARQEFRHLLPAGRGTPDHYFFTIREDPSGTVVGRLWMARRADEGIARAFVYELWIEEPFRRKGFAEKALRDLESVAQGMGLSRIGLHVFGYNEPAIALYRKLGYVTTDLIMERALESPPQGGPVANPT